MKKSFFTIAILIVLLLLSFRIEAKTFFPDDNDMDFAKRFFSLLYYYDVQAVRYAKESNQISTQEELAHYFRNQADFVIDLKGSLSSMMPTEKFSKAYIKIFKGLEAQEKYLDKMYREVYSGSSFDEAFAMHNWGFFNAQNQLQTGIAEFKIILNNLSEANQMQILSSTGITEEQLKQDARECEFIMNVQESIK